MAPDRNFMLPQDDPEAPTDVAVGDGEFQDFPDGEPPGPPPDPSKPYIWLDGKWWLLATDTGDGVPTDLGLEGKALEETEHKPDDAPQPADEEDHDAGS